MEQDTLNRKGEKDMFWSKKKVRQLKMTKNQVNHVQMEVIYRGLIKKYHYSCGLQNICKKPAEMPSWALEQLAISGIEMLGGELALKHAESFAIVGIAKDLPNAIKSKMNCN